MGLLLMPCVRERLQSSLVYKMGSTKITFLEELWSIRAHKHGQKTGRIRMQEWGA